ncbi:MAG: GNAT family N-acetyltransferase [Anaerolineales bacterium]|nr:MAG: GNAT family N-acetyltransferase [Anaerolineales bacterium]
MITHVFQTADDFKKIEPAWADLLDRAQQKSPFQDPGYNQIWWSTLGGGEWQAGELWVFAGYDQTERLVGLAPLFLSQGTAGPSELKLIGSSEISDYLDFILDPEYALHFIDALLDRISNDPPGGCQRLVLDNLLEGSATIPLLESSAREHGWQLSKERIQPSPLLELPSSFEAYLENLGSKQRREFKRKMRHAVDYPASVTWRIEESSENIAHATDVFLDLMANDAKKRTFLTPSMREYLHALAALGAEAGWLHLAFLEVSGDPVFGYLNFIAQNRLWVYNSGFNPDHFALSPGWVLMGYLIQWAIEKRFEAIDFMRGDEDYKYRLGGVDRFVCRLILEP